MKKNKFSIFWILPVTLLFLFSCGKKEKSTASSEEQSAVKAATTPEDLGWKIGAQTYTFREFTLAQAFDKIDSLGLQYAELYAGQDIGGGIDGKVGLDMTPEQRQQVLDLARDKGITIVNFGVMTPHDEADWKKLFDFAKAMGIQTLTSEPAREDLDLVEKLADEYEINVAFHNHPAPSPYYSPDSVLAAVEGRSHRLGSCADVGHWVRSGLDPIECLKKLEGRIITFHIKDVSEKSPHAEDVVWGTGVCDIPGIVDEMKRQNWKGVWSIEYEAHPENNMSLIRQSLNNFYQYVAGS